MRTAARLRTSDSRRLLAKLQRALTHLQAVRNEMVRTDPNLRELFEERAAVRQFDAKLPRADAELLALLDLLRAGG